MKGKSKKLATTLVLGLGLTMALLWILSRTNVPTAHATDSKLEVVKELALSTFEEVQHLGQRSTLQANNVLTVCLPVVGTCPYTNVQAAVDVANNGDVIKVASGVYTDIHHRIELTQVVYINKAITIRGGYTTTNWTTSDPVNNPTVLDAQRQGRVLCIIGGLSNIPHTIEGLQLINGLSTGCGGGLYISGKDWVVVRKCQISGNTAVAGGGIYLANSDNVTLEDNRVFRNTSTHSAGGGIVIHYSHNATLARNVVYNNEATIISGGGIYVYESDTATLTRNQVYSNTASWHGGGIALADSYDAALTNNLVASNQADRWGGGLFVQASSAQVIHNTVIRNQSRGDSGIYVTQVTYGEDVYYSTVTLTNTILVSHSVGISVTSGNTVTVDSILWYGTPITISQSIAAAVTVLNQHEGDPAFVNPSTGNYHIGVGSAAIDAGTEVDITTDIDGQTRPHYDGHDLGADEFWAIVAVKTVTSDTVEPGDFITYTIALTNATNAAMTVYLTDTLPAQVDYVGPITYTSGTAELISRTITWMGSVLTTTPTLITWSVQVLPDVPLNTTISNVATIRDAYGSFETNPAITLVPQRYYYIYLPMVARNYQ